MKQSKANISYAIVIKSEWCYCTSLSKCVRTVCTEIKVQCAVLLEKLSSENATHETLSRDFVAHVHPHTNKFYCYGNYPISQDRTS